MRKQNLLKLAFAFMAVFVFAGAFAQGDATHYGLITVDPVTANTSYVTQGATIPLFVQPDLVYHPTWTAFSNNLTSGFTWVFTAPAGITLNQPNNLNYVEITGDDIGTHAVNVYELAPVAFGGCHDAGQNFDIIVTGKPTATISGSNTAANDWTETTANHEYFACGNKVAETITVGITEQDVPAALQTYAYSVEKLVENIDINDNATEVSRTNIIDHTIETKGNTGNITTGDLTVQNSKRTRYTFTLASATDAPATFTDGIVSAVSHKSDYLTLAGGGIVTGYPFTGTLTVVYIVNPAPVTGPIYHIPNNFNL